VEWEWRVEPFDWTCPHCDRAVTLTKERFSSSTHTLLIENANGRRITETRYMVCPNQACRKFTLEAHLWESQGTQPGLKERRIKMLGRWVLFPVSAGTKFPDYIPYSIRADYLEAFAIKTLSPKASATLARRCLQGMLRDYWSVTPGRLFDEINEVKDKVDPLTWAAIEAVRKLGNIGAHMEKDINVIVDVDANEAELLIGLIERLLEDWYIARKRRETDMTSLINAAAAKTGQ
jgi:hypothetical protein